MANTKKRIVYVITRSEEGGAQTHVFSLIKSYYQEFEITLITGEKGFLEQASRKLGVEVVILPALQRGWSIWGDIRAYFQLRELFKSIGPDLIHFHSTKAGIVGRLAAKNKYKTVFTAHGWVFAEGAPQFRRQIGKILERFTASKTDKIITVSDADYQLALDYKITAENKIERIHNGIEFNSTDSEAQTLKNDPLKLVMVARLVEQKDHATLIHSLRFIETPCELLIVGDGPLEETIKSLIDELGLRHCVRLMGNSTQVMAILKHCDIFVLSTNWEGFPISVLEAMSLRLPIVATRVGGIAEQVIHNETGFLVEPQNPESMASYLSKLLEDDELRVRLGNNAYQLLKEKFNLELMLQKTKDVYSKLLVS